MAEYLIVHRAAEIYKLRFMPEGTELVVSTGIGIFYPIDGWLQRQALDWLDDRGFEYYWEDDNADR